MTDDKIEIGLASLSSGEKHLLRILIDSLRIGENLMLIDEPEISLHIDWQKDLLTSIHELSPNCQLVVATHSPEVMSNISDDNIISL